MPGTRRRLLVVHPALAPYRIDLFNALDERYCLRVLFLNRDVTYQSYDQGRLRNALRADHGFLDRGFEVGGRLVRFGIGAEMRSFRPDVVVTHEFSPATFAALWRSSLGERTRHVVWTADSPMVIASESPLRTLARRLALPRMDGLVVYSEETKAHYQRRFGFGGAIGICPNSQSEGSFRRRIEEALPRARDLAEGHGLMGKKVILYVGRLAAVKRIDRLIDAFAEVRRRNPAAALVVVGGGPERAALEARIAAHGLEREATLVGHVEGPLLQAWFACGSVFALASEFEPWGAVVNEALLAGLPVVCSKQAGARALIDDGVNGDVVDAGDPMRLATALGAWVGSCEPVGPAQFSALRPSRMTEGFRQAIEGFCSVVEAVARPPGSGQGEIMRAVSGTRGPSRPGARGDCTTH